MGVSEQLPELHPFVYPVLSYMKVTQGRVLTLENHMVQSRVQI